MPLVNLANSPEEAKEYSQPVEMEAPRYPYGLCIDLNDEVLKKLGIDTLPPVGTVMHITAVAKVTSVSERENEDGADRCINLQITDMDAVPGPMQPAERRPDSEVAKRLYG